MKIGSLFLVAAAAVTVGAATRRAPARLARAAAVVGDAVAPNVNAAPTRSDKLLVRLYQDALDDRLFAVAAGVAFYALLALVPSLAVAVSLFGLIADPERLARLPGLLTSILPHEAVTLVQDEAQRLAEQTTPSLSIKLGVALFLSLWGASAAVRSFFDALNVIDEQEEARSLVRLYATALGATLAGVAVLSLSIVVIGADPRFVALGPMSAQTVQLYGLLRWPLFFGVATLVIAALYWIGPSHPPARLVRLLPGAAGAALLWALGSAAFGAYVSRLGNYSATYGSLGAVVVVMTWLWLSAAIVLLGAQLNFELNAGAKNNR